MFMNYRLWTAACLVPLLIGLWAIRVSAQDDTVTDAAAPETEETEAAAGSAPANDPDETEPKEPGASIDPEDGETGVSPPSEDNSKYAALLASLTIFVLAVFVGFEVITKVPPTLHTPLMSGSNAISGITIVGALLATGYGANWFVAFVGMIALILATINVVGGFLVTHRMLEMFRKK